jgi:hypothetical protein
MALLYVTVEGFLELKIDNPEIGSLLSEQHPVDLKLFRNSVFHPQKNFDRRERMHEMEKLNWAKLGTGSPHCIRGLFCLSG